MGFLSIVQSSADKLILWAGAHSSALYTSIGVGSGFGAMISGIAVTPEVTRKLDNEKAERRRRGEPKMTALELIKMVAPSYILPASLFGISATCFILNTIQAERKIATLAGLYSMSERGFEEYRNKVKEIFGDRKELKVRDEIAADKAKASYQTAYILTGDGNYPCLDAWSNTKFKSSQLTIEKARIAVLDRLRNEMYISLEEVYEEMHLPIRKDQDGMPLIDRSDIGWNQDNPPEFVYTYTGDSNGEPMMVISFMPPPYPDFKRLF